MHSSISQSSCLVLISTLLFFNCSAPTNNVDKIFNLNDNGITIMCSSAEIGQKGIVNGVEYEAVDRDLLLQRRDEGSDLTKICVSSVTDMTYMFQSDSSFNQDISNWDVSNVTSMGNMFSNSDFNQDISNWDVSNVTSMRNMFYGTPFNQDISNWDVSNVTNMMFMFYETPFNKDISNWDVRNVIDTSVMFYNSRFNQDINNWDVSNVNEMQGMFYNSRFNQDINNWDVSNVTDMKYMFQKSSFNQDISNWCVSQFSQEPAGFSNDSPLKEENKPKWGTCPSN